MPAQGLTERALETFSELCAVSGGHQPLRLTRDLLDGKPRAATGDQP